MESLREIFRIGKGPSSSHTMGPQRAAVIFAGRHPEAARFEVTLYGSLAATGKGHMTDKAIIDVLKKVAPVEIVWEPEVFLPYHPNGMLFRSNGRYIALVEVLFQKEKQREITLLPPQYTTFTR